MSRWDTPDIAQFRADEARRRRWWAENFSPDYGQREPRCSRPWTGRCDRLSRPPSGLHDCARPESHPEPCMCYCGARAPARAVPPPPRPVPRGVQETLI